MSKYLLIPGKDPLLSAAEWEALWGCGSVLFYSESFFIAQGPADFDQQAFNRLGGFLKAAPARVHVPSSGNREALLNALFEAIQADKKDGKLQYAVSVYGWPEKNLRSLLLGLKARFRTTGFNSRFANVNFMNLSAAQKKGLKGQEWLVIKSAGDFWVGPALAGQDIDAYSRRDYEKPFRSMKVGMLPPKLAQMLINLTGVRGAVWDPFCGGGTVLMEGLLMGRAMMGSDVDERVLAGARQNLNWLSASHQNLGAVTSGDATLFYHDARKPLASQNAEYTSKAAAIAFEGYLGPPQMRAFDVVRQKSLLAELEALYTQVFAAFKAIPFRGPIVAALPAFRTARGMVYLAGAIQAIERMGFKAEPLFAASKTPYLLYARPDQWVGRQIVRWRLHA